MISILIPIYNYNTFPLVKELHKQCTESGISFEILCQDDASLFFLNENQRINSLENCNFSRNNSNLGRGLNINSTAQKARFEWLLIMDCDTVPKQNNFIRNYILQIDQGENLVFGGIEYRKEKPANNQLLRWFYGSARESLSVEKRNSNPNANSLTSNLLIKKEVFVSTKFDESITRYGYEDLVFLSNFKKKGVLVKHIDNPTYHLGLETSTAFLNKTKTALENLKLLSKTSLVSANESKIIKTYSILKSMHLNSFATFLFKKTQRKIEKNLLSKKPSLFLFDWFKLGYFCSIQ